MMDDKQDHERLKTELWGLSFKNPVMPASGSFASGREYGEYLDLNCLGAVITKGVAPIPWRGNPAPRVAETYGGMLNSVGLQNSGLEVFKREDLPFLEDYDTRVGVNVVGKSVEEYVEVVKGLRGHAVDFFEVNISCHNVKEGGVAFGVDPDMANLVTEKVKKVADKPVIMKLSPNVTDIVAIGKACEEGGADGLSLINTLMGMKIDIKTGKPLLGNVFGGLSGPAIKPVALRMVYQLYPHVKIPIIGIGGIRTWQDALEFIMAGASGVQVGTANFQNPRVMIEIIEGLDSYLKEENIGSIREITGISHQSVNR